VEAVNTNRGGTVGLTYEQERRFQHHPPRSNDEVDFYAYFRVLGKEMAEYLVSRALEGRELSLALTKLEEAVMWGNAAVARHGIRPRE
jgi:hypothetical protein